MAREWQGLYVTVDFSMRQPAGSRGPNGEPLGGQFVKGFGLDDRQAEMQGYANEIQGLVAENIRASVKRRSVSTGRLVEVTNDRRNIEFGIDGFSVGMPAFLNRSQAKYWRLIEEGSKGLYGKGRGFKGYQFKGFFGGGRDGYGTSKSGDVVLHGGPPFTRIGAGSGGKFIPIPTGGLAGIMVIGREIAAQGAYRRAWSVWSEGGKLRALAVNEAFDALNLKNNRRFGYHVVYRG